MRRGRTCDSSTHHVVLLGYFEAGSGEGLFNQPVCVEIYLPVVLVVAVRTHGQYRSRKIEGKDLYVGRRIGHNVWNARQGLLERRHRYVHIHAMRQLGGQVHSSVSIGGVILDDVAEDFAVTDD